MVKNNFVFKEIIQFKNNVQTVDLILEKFNYC